MGNTATPCAIDPHDTRRRIFATVGASLGNLVEWFDFCVYAFNTLYFAPALSPSGDCMAQLLSMTGMFVTGSLMRPVDDRLFGHIVDEYGRCRVMMTLVLIVYGGSLLIAVLPTYAQIGALAPLLLLVVRPFRGLPVGDEYGTGATYINEVALQSRCDFLAPSQYMTLIGGQLCAMLVLAILQQLLTIVELKAQGWCIPFVVGTFTALIALYLHKSPHEMQTASAYEVEHTDTIRNMWQHKGTSLRVIGFTVGGLPIFYTFATCIQKYFISTAHMETRTASSVMTGALLACTALQPVFGVLSGRIGRRNSMLLFEVFSVLDAVPLMKAPATVTTPLATFGLIMVALAIASFYTSISGLIKAGMFPPETRAMGVDLSHTIVDAVFGGSTEYVALWFRRVDIESTFYWYVTALCAVSSVVVYFMLSPNKEGYPRHTP